MDEWQEAFRLLDEMKEIVDRVKVIREEFEQRLTESSE